MTPILGSDRCLMKLTSLVLRPGWAVFAGALDGSGNHNLRMRGPAELPQQQAFGSAPPSQPTRLES